MGSLTSVTGFISRSFFCSCILGGLVKASSDFLEAFDSGFVGVFNFGGNLGSDFVVIGTFRSFKLDLDSSGFSFVFFVLTRIVFDFSGDFSLDSFATSSGWDLNILALTGGSVAVVEADGVVVVTGIFIVDAVGVDDVAVVVVEVDVAVVIVDLTLLFSDLGLFWTVIAGLLPPP